MQPALDELESRGIAHELEVRSAHRTPDAVAEYCRGARDRGLKVIIAGAGLAAALPGVAAAHTDLPGHRRPAPLVEERARRPRRAPLDRADAAGRSGRLRRRGQREERGSPRRAHPHDALTLHLVELLRRARRDRFRQSGSHPRRGRGGRDRAVRRRWGERAGLEAAIEEAAPGRPNVIATARGSAAAARCS